MEAAVVIVAHLVVGLVMMFDTEPEPAPPPVLHSPMVNACHPVEAAPTGEVYVDRTVDLCRRSERTGR